MRKKIRCHYCRCLFYPNPGCLNPKACGQSKCQRNRKYEAHKRWLQNNPEIVQDRRQANRDWFASHPDYLKNYRRTHPAYVEKNKKDQARRRRRHKEPPVDKSIPIGQSSLIGYSTTHESKQKTGFSHRFTDSKDYRFL